MNEQSMELFQSACGVMGPLQLHIASPEGQEVVHLTLVQPFALIGSDPNNDLSLSHPQVSRRHAYLQIVGGHLFLADLKSRTGIRWGEQVAHSGWLERFQPIGIGPYQVLAEMTPRSPSRNADQPPDSNPLASRSLDPEPLPSLALEFLNGQTRQPLWTMRSTLALVGRLPGCQVRLVESSVSRFHCSLVRTPAGVWVVDLLGREGIQVNGERVRHSRLTDGDQLQVGRFQMRVHSQAVAQFPSPFSSANSVATSPPASESRELVSAPGPLPRMLPVAAPESVPGSETTNALLVPLISQFNQMQQQMFDQFHQSVLMMVQMFSALHRDQMGLIREELDRLHNLTQELQILQGELARAPQEGGSSKAAKPALPNLSSQDSDGRTLDLLKEVKELLLNDRKPAASSGNGGSPRPAARKTAPAPRPAERKPTTEPTPPRPAPAPAATGPLPSPTPATNGEGPLSRPSEDVHAWLQQRIASIQEERETRWQRILNFMMGR